MDVRIREMTIEDYDAARIVWERCRLPLGDDDSQSGIARLLERNAGLSFVAEVAGAVVGTVVGAWDGRRGYVRHVAVLSPYRRRGIAGRLLAAAERAFADIGIHQANLHVRTDNLDVVAYYERAGWKLRRDIVTLTKDLPRV